LSLFIASCLIAGALTGCGSSGTSASGSSDSGSGGGTSLTEVKWVSPAALASLDFCWIYVADALGYLEDEGIKLSIIECTDGSDAKYLAAGSADFGGFSPAVGLSAVDAGASNITAVCNVVVDNIFGLAYQKNSGISDWSDLEGKNIAILAESFPTLFNPILSAAGVDTSTVNYVVYGSAEYEALDGGQADAMGTWTSEYYKCLGMGYDWGYLDGNDVLPQIANSLWVNNDYASKNSETVKGFVRAVTKAIYFCYLNPEAAADITLNRYPEIEITWDGAVGAVKGNVYGMLGTTEEEQKARVDAHEIGVYDMDGVSQTISNLYQGGAISQELDASDYYTNDYVDTSWDYAAVQADSDAYQFSSAVYQDANGS
ncbi:MAG: hypothetical protein H6Q60_166, partial [Oscillospiraceae bacterium]|nr:hypothetical protein [Oscillospiraceae bacterium]